MAKVDYRFKNDDNVLSLITELASTKRVQYFIGEVEVHLYDINRKALPKTRGMQGLLERNKKRGYLKFRTIFNYPELVGNCKVELHEKGNYKLDNMLRQNRMELLVGALTNWLDWFNSQKRN